MKGCIVQRSKGSWRLLFDAGRDPQTGKRCQKSVTVRGTKKDAERKLREMLHSLEMGGYVNPTTLTVGEYLEKWLRDYVATNTAPATGASYTMISRRHLIPALGSLPLVQLRPHHLQGYYARKLSDGRAHGKGGLSPRTVLHHHRVLSEALQHAVKWGLVARNVATAVDPPRPRTPQMVVMKPEEVKAFLESVRGSTHYPIFYLALATGMRRGEILGLRWRDVDLDMATLSVSRSLQRLPGQGFIYREPKSARGRRQVALPPSAALMLREHRKQAESTGLLLGRPISDDDLVFGHPDGSPWDPASVTHAFVRIARRTGLRGIRLHDLRHTHASLMLKQGVHPKVVSERLGHATISITLDTYSHVLPGLQEAAALRFDEVLPGLPANILLEARPS